jgi:hypothetical protein
MQNENETQERGTYPGYGWEMGMYGGPGTRIWACILDPGHNSETVREQYFDTTKEAFEWITRLTAEPDEE